MKTTVFFYMKWQPKQFRTFDTPAEAKAFMLALSENPDCECYGTEKPVVIKSDKKSQKYPRGTIVRVRKDLPESMKHFPSGFTGVVEYSCAEKFGGYDFSSYSLIRLNKKGNPVGSLAWYQENQLIVVSNDVDKGKDIIEKYHFGK